MALHRFFAQGPLPPSVRGRAEGDVVPLSDADVHHLRDVLRLDSGDEVVVVAEGSAYRVRLTAVEELVVGRVTEDLPGTAIPSVTLVQGLAKGEKMDDIVRQVTELGISRVVPFAAERSVVKLDGGKARTRVERWRRIAAEAAKQSQRLTVPRVDDIAGSAELSAVLFGSLVLVCWEDAEGDAPGIGDALRAAAPAFDQDVAVVVGPEGGLTGGEVEALRRAGAAVVSLGTTVLRTETAGVVAPALALYERGALGGSRA